MPDGAPAHGAFPAAGRWSVSRYHAGRPASGSPLLEARSVSIEFGGIRALSDVSVRVEVGEAVGIVGPNGAGKTTLFNCLCGQYCPARGSVWFDGKPIDGLPSYRRARLGIARTFQRVEVFPEMTVLDHLLVAERARRGDGRLWKDLLNMSRVRRDELDRIEAVLGLVGLADMAATPVGALSLGHCRLVELGRALCLEPRLLMADEPSSGLDTGETAALADLFRRVQQEKGMAILLVEHDLDMVARVVDRAMVLDFGELVAEGRLDEVMADPLVRRAYLGRAG
ncbi:MAG: ABC transporter ATP-binding protein [Acidimicrobiales bacterium]